MLTELINKNRSYRRFQESEKIPVSSIEEMVNMARLSASAANKQSLKYIISNTPDWNKKIFSCLAWAGYLTDWPGPVEGERPSAYIIMLNDHSISTNYFCDHGIAAQSILLKAVEMGYGGCIIASVNKKVLGEVFELSEDHEILQVLALGKPIENIVIEEIEKNGDIKYWRDESQVHHVPKRKLGDIIVKKL